MSRYLPSSIFAVVLLGAAFSFAASQKADVESNASLHGKAVIIQMKGVNFGVKENVRIESSANLDFLVFPMQNDETKGSYDEWLPLDRVDGLKVFDSKEQADAHHKKKSPDR